MSRLEVLQAARLKGRMTTAAGASATGLSADAVQAEVDALISEGLLLGAAAVRITPEGRIELNRLLDEERRSIDQSALVSAYHDFEVPNNELKAIVSSWQIKPDGSLNDHADADYDHGIVERLTELHAGLGDLPGRMIAAFPRLAPYPVRLGNAITALQAGDTAYIARPTVDSYHQVWFELHEDLIGGLGRTREEETKAGRA